MVGSRHLDARLPHRRRGGRAAVAAYYGKPAGDQLTTLLKQHITIAVDLIKAAKAGNKAVQQQADARWQQNGVDIADFLSKANPHWPRATLVDLMKTHLSTTTAEVVARLTRNWDADVKAFDEVGGGAAYAVARAPGRSVTLERPTSAGTIGSSTGVRSARGISSA